MPTEIISTIDPGGGGDYTTLAAWEAATDNDLVAADQIQVAELVAGSHPQSSTLTIAGATTNAECYRVIRAQAGARYNPITGTGALIEHTGAGHPLNVREEGFRFEGVGIDWTSAAPTASNAAAIFSTDTVNSSGVASIFDGVTVHMNCTNGSNLRGIVSLNQAYPVCLRNFIVIGDNTSGNLVFGVLASAFPAGSELSNCVVYGAQFNGINIAVDTASTLSNLVASGGGTDFAFNGTTNLTLQSLASEDATAVGTGAVTGINPATAFRNAANNDFRLAAGSPLIDAGVDLSDLFTTDIRGQSYGDTWNIGAYAGPALDSVVTKTGWSRADDIRIETFTITDATTVAVLDTTGYDSVHIIPLGGVGTDPTSGTLTFVPYAVAMKSGPFDPASSEEWARLGNSARIINRATITSTAVGHGYITTPPQYIVLAPSGGTGWANVPVRVEYRKSKEHWQRVGRG